VCIGNVLWNEPSCGIVETMDMVHWRGEDPEFLDYCQSVDSDVLTDASAWDDNARQSWRQVSRTTGRGREDEKTKT